MIHDRAIEYDQPGVVFAERQFKPRNYDEKWHGYLTLREALANSHNIPAVILMDRVGAGRVIETARAMGITTYLPPVLSLTLGSGGVRLLEMARAYAVFANNGLYYDSSPILRITDLDNRPVWEHRPRGKPALIPEVAFMITDILADERTRQAIFGTTLNVGVPAAVKTGTTNDFRDSWAVGYTPDLVVGVWVGNTDNSEMRRVPGSQGGGVIWRNFMQVATSGQVPQLFQTTARSGAVGGVRLSRVFLAVGGAASGGVYETGDGRAAARRPCGTGADADRDPGVDAAAGSRAGGPWPGAVADPNPDHAANPGRAAGSAMGRLGSASPSQFVAPAAESIDTIALKFYTSYCHRLRSLGLVRCQPHADGAAAPGSSSGPTRW